ncbi:MAG: hypothetical protein WC205_01250 [Opitutaceae bacterium]
MRVIFVSGQASLQRPDEPTPRPIVKGETVIIGTRIVTGPDGRVVLTPMPGVKSIVSPNTILLLESVSESQTSTTEVTHHAVLDLKEGAVVSDLHKPEGVAYDYSIRTARGLAGARGTTFTVGINAAGIQTVIVSHGTISLSFSDGRQVSITPGQLSISQPDGTTQKVGNVSELSPEDQAAAQTWADTTISAISSAVENGIELDPAALKNALDVAKSLGVTLSPEVKAAADHAIETARKPSQTTDSGDGTKSDPTDVVTKTVSTDPVAIFRARLKSNAPDLLTSFGEIPSDVQLLLATLNDLDITRLALSPDRETGLPLTYDDLRIHLPGFIKLSQNALTFVKGFASSTDELRNAPDPSEWSAAAFERTLTSWNALGSSDQLALINLGSGQAIMDTSPAYIQALLTSLDSGQRTLIADAGWGSNIGELAGKPTSVTIFSNAGNLNANELKVVKAFEIDPGYFHNSNVTAVISALANTSSQDQIILRQLGIGYALLNTLQDETMHDYASEITATLSFYNSLTPAQQSAVRALGIGEFLYQHAPGEVLPGGNGTTTASLRVQLLAQYYNSASTATQQALRDTGIFSDYYFLGDASPLDETLITNTLNAYTNLPDRTRTYLATGNKNFSFFQLATSTNQPNGQDNTKLRSLAEINDLLSPLSESEFQTLLDLDIGKAVIGSRTNDEVPYYFLGTTPQESLQALKATIAYYTQLNTIQKFVLRELGILNDGNVAFVGADTAGLSRLLTAYGNLSGTLRAATEQLNEKFFDPQNPTPTYGNTMGPVQDRSFFFPRGYQADTIMYSVGFASTGDLYVGATRYLRIDGSMRMSDTFTTGAGKDLYLYAANLIDLNSTSFSAGIRSITMSAATINLQNINFPEGSVASLNSKLGLLNFGSSSTTNGKINLTNVTYGYRPLNSAGDLTSPTGANGNIVTGTLANPAPLPILP